MTVEERMAFENGKYAKCNHQWRVIDRYEVKNYSLKGVTDRFVLMACDACGKVEKHKTN